MAVSLSGLNGQVVIIMKKKKLEPELAIPLQPSGEGQIVKDPQKRPTLAPVSILIYRNLDLLKIPQKFS